ncbi:putative late blight resistance protein R1A-10 [Salvia divinorum]|uniref:Late blight resistance protein R1A-10 n=1 Tax=Salvia divinorum TaxID=28513 RepID=A0ABD1GEH5_SALDI
MLGRIELVDCNPSVLTRAKQIQPTRRVHLDIIATSSVDKKPVTINFRSYSESEKEALDMASMVVLI